MLNALKNVVGGNKGSMAEQISQERDHLQQLLARFRDERVTIDKMLTTLTSRTDELRPLGQSLDQVTEHATDLSKKLDEIGRRAAALELGSPERERLDQDIQALKAAATRAERSAEEATEIDDQLQEHRERLERLSSQAVQTQESLDTLKKDRVAFEEFRSEMRALAARLTEDSDGIRNTSREARDDAHAARATVQAMEKTLGPLAKLQELSRTTEARVVTLNALAEHVSLKAKGLDRQQHAVEHAVVQANRVNEMVWSMDQQIAKLHDAMKQAASSEETLARIDTLSDRTTDRLSAAQKLFDETRLETAKLEMQAGALLESLQVHVTTLGVRKKESDSLNERLRAIHAAVGAAEVRVSAMTEKEKHIFELMKRVDGLSTRLDKLSWRAEELTKRQVSFDALHEKLAQFHELARNTARQIEVLQQSRRDLDAVRNGVREFHKSHAEVAQLVARLGTDREALETFDQRMTALAARAPELEAKVDAVLGKLALVEEATQKAIGVNESVAALDGQIARVTDRATLVDKLEMRLNFLNTLSADVDEKLQDQLARRGELDTLVSAQEGLGLQIADAQHKVDGLRALQEKLLPLAAEVRSIKAEADTTRSRLAGMKLDEASAVAHEKRLSALEAAGCSVEGAMAEHTRQMHVLSEELERAAGVKDELFAELERVQNRQGDITSQIQSREAQVARAEKMFEQFEQRRKELAGSEKTLLDVESRLADIRQAAREINNGLQSIISREQVVHAVKAEVEEVHEISARSKAALDDVMQRSGEVAALKTRVDQLLSQVAETDERVASIESHRRLVDEVHSKANAIVHLFDDVRINLETLGEQKAVVEHMGEKVGQLQFTVQEAESTLRSLQQERELAQRIEQGIRQLRLKAVRPEEEPKPA